ncbi:MAG: segregation/condensation protein A [Phycisphaerales bacterium]|nr:segregation/condensation protein A [Phycisphaerales bacterium]
MSEYTVRLDDFEGPLDLLLHLIRKAELDVTHLSLARVTDQFLKHLEHVERIDVESAAEFLLTAATLLEIKSRHLGPSVEAGEADDTETGPDAVAAIDDPAAELLRQLLAYKTYREAGDTLERQREQWSLRYPAGQAGADKAALREAVPDELDMDELDLFDLVRAFQRIIDTVELSRIGEHTVGEDDTPIELHAADLVDLLHRETAQDDEASARTGKPRRYPLLSLLKGRTKPQAIGLFLAMLELMKQQRIRVLQERPDDSAVHDAGHTDATIVVELVDWQAITGASALEATG